MSKPIEAPIEAACPSQRRCQASVRAVIFASALSRAFGIPSCGGARFLRLGCLPLPPALLIGNAPGDAHKRALRRSSNHQQPFLQPLLTSEQHVRPRRRREADRWRARLSRDPNVGHASRAGCPHARHVGHAADAGARQEPQHRRRFGPRARDGGADDGGPPRARHRRSERLGRFGRLEGVEEEFRRVDHDRAEHKWSRYQGESRIVASVGREGLNLGDGNRKACTKPERLSRRASPHRKLPLHRLEWPEGHGCPLGPFLFLVLCEPF
ncbi:hypothetical protein DFJ74DRAFT_366630 [Hyaloraphidium curvatum]|nr:hypothetical protein DFJ74DRAFT_366630 [Hyaloraphidium curvatum]